MRSASHPNRDLYINQGAGRRVGGNMLELYTRYDTWRVGKFVQDFGRAYSLLPGPFAADFIEEAEEGYEPTEMLGIEKIHVFGSEERGWQQLSVSAFVVDRTFLHESFPYNEGIAHYKDGGVGNTHLPENVMVTYDVLNMPITTGTQATFQASVIRFGKSYQAQRGEIWTTLGGDIAIPLHGSLSDTLQGRYSQFRLYIEAARRDNFNGFAGRARNFVSLSGEYLAGQWAYDLTTTQRWTTDSALPTQKDALYTAILGHDLPSRMLAFPEHSPRARLDPRRRLRQHPRDQDLYHLRTMPHPRPRILRGIVFSYRRRASFTVGVQAMRRRVCGQVRYRRDTPKRPHSQ